MAAAGSGALAYLDNNATTVMPQNVVDAVVHWMNRGSPSAEYALAREAQKMMRRFREFIADEGRFDLHGPRGYTLVFTSGGSEGNAHVLTAAARAYATRTGELPHIVTSAAEHRSVLACCRRLTQDRMAQLTVLPVRGVGRESAGRAGTVDPEKLRQALRANTCLVSIVAANPETGALNDVRALGAIAHARRVPFHTDAALLFGKSRVLPADLNLDAFTVAFHKLHGPPGVGLLGLRNDFLEGYGLGALIPGSQNGGLRGGAENLPGIAGAFAAYKLAAQDRGKKNRRLLRLRDGVREVLAQRFLAVHVDDYCEARPRAPDGDPMTPRGARVRVAPEAGRGEALARKLDAAADRDAPVIVWLDPADRAKALPNTILLAVLRSPPDGGRVCNKKVRAALETRGVLVGTGPGAPPHVVEAMDVPPELWPGILRVSLADDTTAAEAAAFVTHFADTVGTPEVLA